MTPGLLFARGGTRYRARAASARHQLISLATSKHSESCRRILFDGDQNNSVPYFARTCRFKRKEQSVKTVPKCDIGACQDKEKYIERIPIIGRNTCEAKVPVVAPGPLSSRDCAASRDQVPLAMAALPPPPYYRPSLTITITVSRAWRDLAVDYFPLAASGHSSCKSK